MLFNSFEFAVFFVVVYVAYLCFSYKKQNILLLVASYGFYAAWDYRFLSLILISTCVDYFCGRWIHSATDKKTKKLGLLVSVATNLSILGYFKYAGFFVSELSHLLTFLGLPFNLGTLSVILPVGISFYTFQTMSYTIDIYRGDMKPTKSFSNFALFVAFFPQLVAGPIERARNLLPQLEAPRKITLEGFYEGCHLIFWGLFLKVFVADNLASIADPVFSSDSNSSLQILFGLYAFAFQIFCDFAGYSSMARGLAKVMGVNLSVNFNLPYFATNPEDFWRRWHITLSNWIRDYVFLPLFISRRAWGKWGMVFAVVVTYVSIGLWHGAAKTFILWGVFHAFIYIVYQLSKPYLFFNKKSYGLVGDRLIFSISVVLFFHVTIVGLLIFRSGSLTQVLNLFATLFFDFSYNSTDFSMLGSLFFFSWILFVVQYLQFKSNDLMVMYKLPALVKGAFYTLCFYSLIIYGGSGGKEFIYFQF
jgi:alginate O-acetyltransferase complex protein AlgI